MKNTHSSKSFRQYSDIETVSVMRMRYQGFPAHIIARCLGRSTYSIKAKMKSIPRKCFDPNADVAGNMMRIDLHRKCCARLKQLEIEDKRMAA